MKHEVPELPYAESALEPHISAETLRYHHGKHHAKYVSNLNELLLGTELELRPLEEIIQKASNTLFNNAAQAWNHAFYWKCLSPNGGGEPDGPLAAVIVQQFGSFDQFKQQFTEVASSLFGSGWTWLVKDAEGNMSIQQTKNADTPLRHAQTPLLTCDVWEHAYYIDYRNARPEYIQSFWKIINWDFVAQQYQG
ncbi:MAG: superoxide dismutase [Pirellulales bacterium]|nr:superoxide dismutase [Pirellulales bacterium]